MDFGDRNFIEMSLELKREKTLVFLRKGLETLSEGYCCLDASRPWLVYWIVHALELLGEDIDEKQRTPVIQFLAKSVSMKVFSESRLL